MTLFSLTSVHTKQPKIYQSFADIRGYERKNNYLFWIKNILLFENALTVLDLGSKTQAITDALIYMLTKDNMPLSTTEKPGFIYFMRQAAQNSIQEKCYWIIKT